MLEYGIAAGGVSGGGSSFNGSKAADLVMSVGHDPTKLLIAGAILAGIFLVLRAI